MPKLYRKKPIVVEAVRWEGTNWDEVREFLGLQTVDRATDLIIKTREGDMLARIGDYLIKGVTGECYPCPVDIFDRTYDPV